MLEFYFADHCPYCIKVRKYLEQAGIAYVTRPVVLHDPANFYANELEKRGGEIQVPYMIDAAACVEMYESDDIIAYLRKHHTGRQQTPAAGTA